MQTSDAFQSAVVEYAPGCSVRLAYRWHDPPEDALPLVCLHGSLCDSTFFDPLRGALPGCRALCIDLPGHGESDRISMTDDSANTKSVTRVESMAAAVVKLLDELAITRADWAIAAHSLGGAVALLVIESVAASSSAASGEARAPRFYLSIEGNATPGCCLPEGLSRRVTAMPHAPSTDDVLKMVENEPACARTLLERMRLRMKRHRRQHGARPLRLTSQADWPCCVLVPPRALQGFRWLEVLATAPAC